MIECVWNFFVRIVDRFVVVDFNFFCFYIFRLFYICCRILSYFILLLFIDVYVGFF